jgi:phage tail sheath gpL-like
MVAKVNGEVGKAMTLNVIHDTDDSGRPTVVVHLEDFNCVASGPDIYDALLSLAQEVYDMRAHYVDEPDERLAPDALRTKRNFVEWFSRGAK